MDAGALHWEAACQPACCARMLMLAHGSGERWQAGHPLAGAQVTGQHAGEEEIERMIESGESETIFQKAILEQVGGASRRTAGDRAQE